MTTTPTAPAALVAFEALGTYVHLRALGDPADIERASRRLLAEVDHACSRFRSDSDLARANAAPGSWVAVSPLLVSAVRIGIAAAEHTDGLVDPCLGRPMIELGYDRDFAELRELPATAPITPPLPGAWREIGVRDDAIRVPAGASVDLGATAKAWASDLLAAALRADFGGGALVSLGGDIAIAGEPPIGGWPVLITEHPRGLGDRLSPAQVTVDAGGLATSSTAARRWRRGTVDAHHLLDPRTGMPVQGPLRTVTATGPTCVAANVAATAALVLQSAAPAWLDRHHIDARLIGVDDTVRLTGRWPGGKRA